MEIPNAFISKCITSQEHDYKFCLIVAFVRAVIELNQGSGGGGRVGEGECPLKKGAGFP